MAQTLRPRIQDIRMATPIFILGIKDRLERSYVVDLGVIYGNGRLNILTLVVKERGVVRVGAWIGWKGRWRGIGWIGRESGVGFIMSK